MTLYCWTWQERRGSTLHALVLKIDAGVKRYMVACNQTREAVGGHHWDYRTTGAAVASPTCGHQACQRMFHDPEGANHG